MGGGEQQQETDNFWETWQASPEPQARVFSIGPWTRFSGNQLLMVGGGTAGSSQATHLIPTAPQPHSSTGEVPQKEQSSEGMKSPWSPGKKRPFCVVPAGSASAAAHHSLTSGTRSRHCPSPVGQENAPES